MLNTADPVFNCPIGNVTFEAGCRTFWHSHTGGQILLVLAGEGLYQEKGKPARRIKKGDVVQIAPDVEHWHGRHRRAVRRSQQVLKKLCNHPIPRPDFRYIRQKPADCMIRSTVDITMMEITTESELRLAPIPTSQPSCAV